MDEKALHEHGFAGCLHKPFTVKELLVTLNEGQMSADEAHITHDMQLIADALPEDTLFNFSALTASRKMIRKRRVLLSGLLSKRPARMPTGCNRH